MTSPAPIPLPPMQSVRCYTCLVEVLSGHGEIEDGQPHLTTYADKSCQRDSCPHKTAVIEVAKRLAPATLADLDALKTRIAALERRPTP